jgi:hypothetical protein
MSAGSATHAARDDHEELPKHVSAQVLVVKNDSDDLGRLREELRKVVGKLEKDFLRRR